jgi:putative peptidoglycan lipid II flippase
VAVGILASRVLGLLRERAVAAMLGVGPHADVFRFALRAPNALQNLLGEGTLSSSFIPVYTRLLDQGRTAEARRLAGAVFGLLLALAGGLALAGLAFAEPLVAILASGFLADRGQEVDRAALSAAALRLTFPMTGLLVLSAWALGILNSHRRFFLPYVAPVAWNGAILAGFAWARWGTPDGLTRALELALWGALAGGLLQFLIQLPAVLRVLGGLRPTLSTRAEGVGATLKALGPAVSGRGVVQLASWLDTWVAALLVPGAVGVIGYAQTLYLLPVSLFALSVAASELPELSRGAAPALSRIDRGLRQIAFLTVPTVVGYLAFGVPIVSLLFETGKFGPSAVRVVAVVLAGYALGLLATNVSRLLQNVFFALGDTATPARAATERVLLAAALSVPAMIALDRLAFEPGGPHLGPLGLALGSAVGAWWELFRLRRRLRGSLPALTLPAAAFGRMLVLAAGAAGVAGVLWWALAGRAPWWAISLAVPGAFAFTYLAVAAIRRWPELASWTGRQRRS